MECSLVVLPRFGGEELLPLAAPSLSYTNKLVSNRPSFMTVTEYGGCEMCTHQYPWP